MIELLETGWLYASASGPAATFVDLTFEIPDRSVVATTSISAFSAGVYQNEPGSVATYIREVGTFIGPGSLHIVDIPPDPANNNWYAEHVAYVRFRLTVYQATAWAEASVFLDPAPKPPKPKVDWRQKIRISEFAFVEKGSGKRIGSHRIMALRSRSVLPVDDVLARSASEAAEHLGIGRKKIEIARQRPSRRPPFPRHVF